MMTKGGPNWHSTLLWYKEGDSKWVPNVLLGASKIYQAQLIIGIFWNFGGTKKDGKFHQGAILHRIGTRWAVCAGCSCIMSLRSFLFRDFLLHIILRRIVPGPKPSSGTFFLRMTSVTMVTSNFGHYHGLRCEDAPAKCICAIPTPWTIKCSLGFVQFFQVHE